MAHINDKYDFTVSAFILHPTEQKIFLHKHKKLGKWLQPGGHIELDEHPWQALEHELLEECGLDLTKCTVLNQPNTPAVDEEGFINLPIPFYKFVHNFYPDGSHKHIDDTYLLRSYTEIIQPAEGESQEWGWFTVAEIREMEKTGQVFRNTMTIADWISDNYI